MIIESGAGNHIVKNIAKNPSLSGICIKLIGNILAGESEDCDEMIGYGVFDIFINLINISNTLESQKEILWAISNITAGTRTNIKLFIQSNLIKVLLTKANQINSVEVMTEFIWIFSNAIMGAEIEDIFNLLKLGVMDVYINNLNNFNNPKVLLVTLEGLKFLFRFGDMSNLNMKKNEIVDAFCNLGGHLGLERISNHENIEVYETTELLIKEFFKYDQVN